MITYLSIVINFLLWLRNPSFALTDSLNLVIKAFQNPIWTEQAKQRLKYISLLTIR